MRPEGRSSGSKCAAVRDATSLDGGAKVKPSGVEWSVARRRASYRARPMTE